MASQLLLQLHLPSFSTQPCFRFRNSASISPTFFALTGSFELRTDIEDGRSACRCRRLTASVGSEDFEEAQFPVPATIQQQAKDQNDKEEDGDAERDVDPEDLQYVSEIKRVLELLRKNRDMLFSEVKLTVMIEDPREVERRRLLGIEDPDAPTREDLAEALEQVNEGKVPRDRFALQALHQEMINWPNIEVEAPRQKPGKSLYARATDTGVDPAEAAKRLKVDWDSAAEIKETDMTSEEEVPSAVGYGALYLVTAFPVIIGISVVLILFYNSLQ